VRILHTSDWHVGKTIRGEPRLAEHVAVLAEIAETAAAEAVDLIVVAGDLYESAAPSAEAEAVVTQGLLALRTVAPVVAIAGNHDNPARFEAVRPLAAAAGTRPWWFTVLAAENNAARRLLEAGVAGLPHYRAHGDYVMLGLATARGARTNLWRRAQEADLQRALAFHSAHAERFQFSPVLDEATVRSIGLEHFLVHERAGAIAGVAALWNQQAFKQIVARRYRWPIGTLLPMYNGYARICRRVPLPAPGRSLEMTFIAFLALDDDALGGGTALIRDLLSRCDTPVAALGLHASHPLCASLDALRPMRYPSRVYSVSFESVPTVGPLPAQPEVALL